MRKTLIIIMAVTFILTIITGIAESNPAHGGPAVAHIIITIIFIASVLTHLWLNRKACLKYFSSAKKTAGSSG
jgi:hypothetical protein